ncbi:hypothetical protein G7Y89_g8948 [Cudoniella acicularis]|uniref:Uncharacterized protein n=1 Tax=Cudoniella acicularis TaxID=354080 RepID=A0A8H4RJB7_9HELO|nr:hypothetical protein G7Y89_g8948 [Cudoniella acicularis]
MSIAHILRRRILQSSRASFVSGNPIQKSLKTPKFQIRNFIKSPFSKKPEAPIGRKTLYPERLLVYHAGTGRTVFLGSLKITTIFIFTFFCIVVAPTYFNADDQQPVTAAAVLLSGIVPMVVVMYITRPFVNFIHLRLPPFARNSREIMMRYSKNLPKDAEIDITTMTVLGRPRVTRMKVTDLYPVKERFGLANYARNTKEINAKRPWWMGKAVRQFGVHSGRSQIMGGQVWENIQAGIEKRSKAR